MLRYLRIAVTAMGLLASLLAAALWVRSHDTRDVLLTPVPGLNGGIEAISANGEINVLGRFTHVGGPFPLQHWSSDARWGDLGCSDRYVFTIDLPHWNLAFAAGAIALVPWIRWQFGLRTLLIGMTLASVLLGAAMAGNRRDANRYNGLPNYPLVKFGKIWR